MILTTPRRPPQEEEEMTEPPRQNQGMEENVDGKKENRRKQDF
ncbi:hypothetical protein Esi_0544_0016 [Ectocarpus siliculosus]|uniref:Uncharacterized protein n=1 Tax=Ectocarpus siliculosus TaxID=2880 RepID=D7G441_ECTSI|nr:hypothetical protein Esi_0544_0016 [Ectocarpus siliculosus]|eukprot:CBJ33659.1 hypothetical protein Esi_0544_0016 [Ectocarpus siliculosus]